MYFLRASITNYQTEWVKTTGIYSLIVLDDRILNSRYHLGCFLLEALRENLLQASPHFYWLPAILDVPWLVDASAQSLPLLHGILSDFCVYVSVQISLFL